MTDAYDTHADGQNWDAILQNAVNAAIGAIDNVGFYPVTGANYTVFKVGSTYYARNNTHGTIDKDDANADVVMQYCHGQLPYGGLIRVAKGQYIFSDTVTIDNEAIYIQGAGTGYDAFGTECTFGAGTNNKPLFKFSSTVHKFFGGISDMAIDGNHNTGSIGVHIEKFYSDLWFRQLWIKDCASAGVKVEGNAGGAASGSKQWNLWFLYNLIEGCKTGDAYYFTNADSATEKISRVTIQGGHYYDNNNTIKCDAEWVFHCNVLGITVEQEQQHSLNLTGARHWNIFGNQIFDCGTDAANTYSAIYIGGTGGSPPIGINIFGNSLDNTWTSNQKYGIELAGDCNHINIFGNMLDGGGATGDILNGTTGTDIVIGPNTGYKELCDIEHHTAADTLTIAEPRVLHTNLGAGGSIKLTLPQDAVAGTYFEFVVMVAQELQIDPGAAGAIYLDGVKMDDSEYITANAINESIKLVCDGNGDWIALYRYGTWTQETP